MCGICGILNFNQQQVNEAPVRQMMQIMKHRGPDDEGVFIENNVGLGFVRLSIIDLTTSGHQPKLSEHERYVIVFNGEIYNYIELREELIKEGIKFSSHSDTEVLLSAYLHWGEDCLNRFNGMWAFAIYDRDQKTIFAARDRFGIKPFYYIQSASYFAFCSEITPLLTLLSKKPTPDYQTIFDFLTFNRTDQTEKTFYEEVLKLQHGHKLSIIHNKITISKWYDLRESVKKSAGFKNAQEYKELFASAVGLHLRSDVPIGVCLSGGLDSSCITSVLLNDFAIKDLSTFSAIYKIGQIGNESEFIDEYKTLVKNMFFTTPTADSLKNDLEQFIQIHGEPIPSTSPYAQYKVMKLAQGKAVVTLDGQGADEELAGYPYFFGFYFKDLLSHGKFDLLFTAIYQYLTTHRSLFGIKSFLFLMLPEKFRTILRVKEKGYLETDFKNKYRNSNSIAGNLYGSKSLSDALLDHFEYKLEHLLKWEDRNSMKFSLESRVPFLDYRLVEKTFATSSDSKIKNGMTKYILREAMKGIVPERIRMRRDKIGFETPEAEWFRTPEWKIIIEEVLLSQSFKERNLINPAIAMSKYHKHLACKINCAPEIWKWIHLELWFREFID